MNELDKLFKTFSEEKGFESTLLKYRIRTILPFVQGPSILDVGCGVGSLCRALAKQVETVIGLDGSSTKISRAREINKAPNVSFVCDLFENWSHSGKFQTITASGILEHIPNTHSFLKHCLDILSLDGRLIVVVPNALGLHKRIGKYMRLIDNFYTLTKADTAKGHYHVFDRKQLEKEISLAGFQIVHSGGILLKPLSSQQMESWDPKIVEALYEIGKELPDFCSSLIVVAKRID